ncbi:MAG: hypothetical protein WDM76_05510 [Limisphaerales bacterium]
MASYVAPKPLVHALMRYEISLPVRYGIDGVCAISDEFTDRLAARGYPREKICPIYYGYDAEKFPLRSQPPPEGKPPVVVMHGSFDAHHLGRIAIDAVQYVTKYRPETAFRFVGRRTVGLEKFLTHAQTIPNFKFEATGFTPYAEVSNISPAQMLASFLTKNLPERIAPSLPRLLNTSPAACRPLPRPSKAFKAISKTIRW